MTQVDEQAQYFYRKLGYKEMGRAFSWEKARCFTEVFQAFIR